MRSVWGGERRRWIIASLGISTVLWITVYSYQRQLAKHPIRLQAEIIAKEPNEPHQMAAHPWAPYSVSECLLNSPAEFAPCIAASLPHCTYAEELVYPDFQIRMPNFAKDEHRRLFIDMAKRELNGRGTLNSEETAVAYRGQHGQNFVFENSAFKHEVPYDSWSDQSGMGTKVSSDIIRPLTHPESAFNHETLIIVDPPDSWSFQHFMDRGARIVAQATHLVEEYKNVIAITGRWSDNTVREMWDIMGFDESHLLHSPSEELSAKRIIWSGRTVLIHPWVSDIVSRNLRVYPAHAIGAESRNKIMYASRSGGRTKNGGREVLNEQAVLNAIRVRLSERNKGEELVVLDHGSYPSQAALMNDFSQNVKALVGPHGGAMMNHRFMAHQTSVLEFIPTTWVCLENFEESAVLNQRYGAIVVEPIDGGTDMVIDPEDVVRLLEKGLDSEDSTLTRVYPWVVDQNERIN